MAALEARKTVGGVGTQHLDLHARIAFMADTVQAGRVVEVAAWLCLGRKYRFIEQPRIARQARQVADLHGVDGEVSLDQVVQHARKLMAAGAGDDFANLRVKLFRIHRIVHEGQLGLCRCVSASRILGWCGHLIGILVQRMSDG